MANKIAEGIKQEGGIFGIFSTLKRKAKEWKTYQSTDSMDEHGYDYDINFGENNDDEEPKINYWLLLIVIIIIGGIIFFVVRKKKKNKKTK